MLSTVWLVELRARKVGRQEGGSGRRGKGWSAQGKVVRPVDEVDESS